MTRVDGGRPPVEDEPESRLIERAQRGDAAAFEEVVRRYQGLAFRVAYAITGSAADAEEATQDGFVRAYHALGRFRAGAPLRPWLLRIVGNAARNRRAAAARRSVVGLDEGVAWAIDDPIGGPEAVALAAEERGELLAAINRLRDDDQAVIACRYFLALSEAETAAALGCARGTVKSRLSRALRRLRADLSEERIAGRSPRARCAADGVGDG